MWVSQAVAPVLRRQRSGHLVQISSIGGLAGFAGTGLYSASKFALEGLSEAVAHELADFGVDVTIVQPGGYWTDLYTAILYTAMDTAAPLPEYDGLRDRLAAQFAENSVDSDPKRAAEAILELTALPVRRVASCWAARPTTSRSRSPTSGAGPGRSGKP